MTESSIEVGNIPFRPPEVDGLCYTYYKIIGDVVSSDEPPLVIVHGGPGAGHEYLLRFECLWTKHGIPLVLYDQIGCASSTHLRSKAWDESFWQESLFVAELDNLLDKLQLKEGRGFSLFGHSWGCRIAVAYAATQPRGIRRLVLASGMASSESWVKGMHLLTTQLPQKLQLVIKEAQKKQNFDSDQFRDAMGVFQRTFFCRAEPFPHKDLLLSFKYTSEDRTVLDATKGPSPLDFTGSFRDWTCIPRLYRISAPTLLYNGEFDTSQDITVAPLFEHIRHVRWITFPNAGHMCHLEPLVSEKVFKLVGGFLTQKSVINEEI